MISKIRQKISKTRQKDLFTRHMDQTGLPIISQTRHCAEENMRQAKEKPMPSGTDRNTPEKADHAGCETTLSAFFGRGGADETRPSAGRTPRREREEIVRTPRGKLRPEAGDRPAPGREAPAHHPIEGVGAGRNMMRCVLTVVCGAVCRSGRHSERKPARGGVRKRQSGVMSIHGRIS